MKNTARDPDMKRSGATIFWSFARRPSDTARALRAALRYCSPSASNDATMASNDATMYQVYSYSSTAVLRINSTAVGPRRVVRVKHLLVQICFAQVS